MSILHSRGEANALQGWHVCGGADHKRNNCPKKVKSGKVTVVVAGKKRKSSSSMKSEKKKKKTK